MLSIIAAIGKNRELGKDNRLLWSLPSDMKRFKKLTEGHIVIMGRRTFESLPEKFRPLPKRVNIVVTSQNDLTILSRPRKDSKVFLTSSLMEAIEKANDLVKSQNLPDEIFIIGGASIYQQAIDLADKLYLTVIDKNYPEADVFFPDYEKKFKKILYNEKRQENGLSFQFVEMMI
ncbi:MAG: dihydrofolate reductase [Candidatus Microgenomates bacterium]